MSINFTIIDENRRLQAPAAIRRRIWIEPGERWILRARIALTLWVDTEWDGGHSLVMQAVVPGYHDLTMEVPLCMNLIHTPAKLSVVPRAIRFNERDKPTALLIDLLEGQPVASLVTPMRCY